MEPSVTQVQNLNRKTKFLENELLRYLQRTEDPRVAFLMEEMRINNQQIGVHLANVALTQGNFNVLETAKSVVGGNYE